MSIRALLTALTSAPIRITVALAAAFVSLMAVLLVVRPEMMMLLPHSVIPNL
jgi:hypothetical protein